MGVYDIRLGADAISLLVILFTALAAATLVPPVRRSIPWPAELVIWAGFIFASVVRVTSFADPRVREATSSAAWAASRIAGMQAAFVEDAVRAWLSTNRFHIATLAVIVAGLDVLALALIESGRTARRQSRIHLGEWFILPARTAAVADPLSSLDRRVEAWMRHRVRPAAWAETGRAAVAKPFAHVAAHVLGPGPARLHMVKLAAGLERPHEHVHRSGAGRAGKPAEPDPADAARTEDGGKPRSRHEAAPHRPARLAS